MTYPKLRNGPNVIGEALHRALQNTDAPFVSASAAGYSANKYGDGAEVYGGMPNGFFVAGAINNGEAVPDIRVVGSLAARGKFIKVKTETSPGPWSGNVFSLSGDNFLLHYMGDGHGLTYIWRDSNLLKAKLSRDGKKYADPIQVVDDYFTMDGALNPLSLAHFVPGSYRAGIGWSFGAAHLVGESPTQQPTYSKTLDRGETWTAANIGTAGRKMTPRVFRVGPQDLIAAVATILHDGSPGYPDAMEYELNLFASTDDGETFLPISGGTLTTLSEVPDGDLSQANNTLLSVLSSLQFVRLASGQVMATRYYQTTEGALGSYKGGLDGGFTKIIDMGHRFPVRGLSMVGWHPFMHVARTVGGTVESELAVFGSSAVDVEYRPLYRDRNVIGEFMAVDEETLLWPAYESLKFMLKQSKDLGVTWTDRATIYSGTADFVPVFDMPFSSLRYLLKGGSPAPTFPGAPWIGDDRITPPWEE